jgi:hypothetical protein
MLNELVKEAERTGDLTDLRRHCINGYGTNSQRRAVWCLLLNISRSYNPTVISIQTHPDYRQVMRDVNRSFPNMIDSKFKLHKRAQLEAVLMTVLERNRHLHYYQGFHDIAATILTFAREPLTVQILENLANGPLRPYLGKTFSGLTSVLNFLSPILKSIDPELANFFEENEISPAVLVSHILTFFTHTTATLCQALRFLDFFVASHPLMPLYSVATVCLMKKGLVKFAGADSGTIMNGLMDLLTNVDIQVVVTQSVLFFRQWPPSRILEMTKDLKVSRDVAFLDPRVDFGYEFPGFPMVDRIPEWLWRERLDEGVPVLMLKAIAAALAVAGAIGMRMLL